MRGELSLEELRDYAAQYRYLVVALSDLSTSLANTAEASDADTLHVHADEEHAHVRMWDRFVAALEGEHQEALPQTRECVAAWTSPGTHDEQLAAMYVIEASQPAISETKLAGLAAHYDLPEDAPGCEYFREHATRDLAHAQQARVLLRRRIDTRGTRVVQPMLEAARAALAANWRMLDGVERQRPVAAI